MIDAWRESHERDAAAHEAFDCGDECAARATVLLRSLEAQLRAGVVLEPLVELPATFEAAEARSRRRRGDDADSPWTRRG